MRFQMADLQSETKNTLFIECFKAIHHAPNAVQPPSTLKQLPVTKLASSEAKNETTLATSLLVPNLFIGARLIIFFSSV